MPDNQRYVTQASVAHGGFGEVKRYFDQNLERDVAIKFVTQVDHRNPLTNEISALLQMRSKHVVQVYDVIHRNNQMGVVMEYITGTDLFDESFQNLEEQAWLKVMWQIASGIADIHEAGLIHRDIKPNNMKMDSEGIIKLFDFGLARPSDKASTLNFKGTPGFAAPELYGFSGEVAFTQAIDVYAFGAIALYLLWGDLPNELKQFPPKAIQFGDLDHPYLYKRQNLKQLFSGCLSAMPKFRPHITQLQQALATYLTHEQHQAVVVYQDKTYLLNENQKRIALELDGIGNFTLVYTGFDFVFEEVCGQVYVNNMLAKKGHSIPHSCVVAFGHSNRDYRDRAFVTFDVSSPEVIL